MGLTRVKDSPMSTLHDLSQSVVFGPGLNVLNCSLTDVTPATGWKASVASSNEDAGRSRANVVVLQGQSVEGESAMLTAAKLRLSEPRTRIVILGPETLRRSTDHLGVTLLPCTASVRQILGLLGA